MPIRLIGPVARTQDQQREARGLKRLHHALLPGLIGIDVNAHIVFGQQTANFKTQLAIFADRFPAFGSRTDKHRHRLLRRPGPRPDRPGTPATPPA